VRSLAIQFGLRRSRGAAERSGPAATAKPPRPHRPTRPLVYDPMLCVIPPDRTPTAVIGRERNGVFFSD
jgi:hypothetical protein